MIGGFVYRGKHSEELQGKYVFGDFTRTFFPADGRLFWLDTEGVPTDIFEFQIGEFDMPLGRYLFGFGEDEDGELYVLTSMNLGPSGFTGEVFRLVGPESPDDARDHALQTSLADTRGWFTLSSVPPGTYTIYGRLTRKNVDVEWIEKVTVGGAAVRIDLDETTARGL